MIEVCDCTGEFAATGVPVCDTNFAGVEKLIGVQLVANDGTRNYIDLTVTLDQAYWEGKTNEDDESKRFYPFPEMEEISNERAETTKQTFASGNSLPVKQGVKPFSGFGPLLSPTYKKEAEGFGCRRVGFFQVDGNGNVRGNISADGTKLYPTPIQHKSFEINYVEAIPNVSVEGHTFTFEWKRNANDGDFKTIKASSMAGFDVTELGGELNVNGLNPTAIGLTGHSIELTSNYGEAGTDEPIKGLVSGSFEIFNQTTSSVLAQTVVEGPDGTYTFLYAAQTASDVIETRIIAAGYQDSAVRAATVTL